MVTNLRRAGSIGAATTCLVGALTAVSTVGAAPASGDLALADGHWHGELVYSASVAFEEVGAAGTSSGNFDMIVVGGLVTEGTFTFSASSTASATDGTATADLSITGSGGVGGDAFGPILEPALMNVVGVASSTGIEIDVDFALGPGDLTPLPLEIYQASCEEVSGDFVQTISDTVAAHGGTGTYHGLWVALRDADDATAGQLIEAHADLIADIEILKLSISLGEALDPYVLLQFADRAEQLMATAALNEECRALDPGVGDIIFASSAVAVRDLVEAALAMTDTVSLHAMQNLVQLGLRTGVLRANAPVGSTAYELDVQLEADFQLRLASALGPPIDTADVQQIMLTALTMGWAGIASQAASAL